MLVGKEFCKCDGKVTLVLHSMCSFSRGLAEKSIKMGKCMYYLGDGATS